MPASPERPGKRGRPTGSGGCPRVPQASGAAPAEAGTPRSMLPVMGRKRAGASAVVTALIHGAKVQDYLRFAPSQTLAVAPKEEPLPSLQYGRTRMTPATTPAQPATASSRPDGRGPGTSRARGGTAPSRRARPALPLPPGGLRCLRSPRKSRTATAHPRGGAIRAWSG